MYDDDMTKKLDSIHGAAKDSEFQMKLEAVTKAVEIADARSDEGTADLFSQGDPKTMTAVTELFASK